MLLHKEEAIAYNYLIEIELKQLYCRFRHLFIQRLVKVLKRAGYCGGVPRGLLISVDFRGFSEVLS